MPEALTDVVNFNADASCLSSARWLDCLAGGHGSEFCRWLNLYVGYGKKVSLGLTGVTIADIKHFNPEAIEIINTNPDRFELILRPWAHDIGIFRREDAFRSNARLGVEAIKREFINVANFYLPPEFMINSRQIATLVNELDIDGVFINRERYDEQTASRIPSEPYQVIATGGTLTACISITAEVTQAYLRALQLYDANAWSDLLKSNTTTTDVFSWRDGESIFLIPDGLKREEFWLATEQDFFERQFLSGRQLSYTNSEEVKAPYYKSYPVHSFLAWMQEMKMMWFLEQVSTIEERFDTLNARERALFLQLINSDILAAVEKRSPVIRLNTGEEHTDFTIFRQEKGFEGEEFLSVFHGGTFDEQAPYIKKFLAREAYLRSVSE